MSFGFMFFLLASQEIVSITVYSLVVFYSGFCQTSPPTDDIYPPENLQLDFINQTVNY